MPLYVSHDIGLTCSVCGCMMGRSQFMSLQTLMLMLLHTLQVGQLATERAAQSCNNAMHQVGCVPLQG